MEQNKEDRFITKVLAYFLIPVLAFLVFITTVYITMKIVDELLHGEQPTKVIVVKPSSK